MFILFQFFRHSLNYKIVLYYNKQMKMTVIVASLFCISLLIFVFFINNTYFEGFASPSGYDKMASGSPDTNKYSANDIEKGSGFKYSTDLNNSEFNLDSKATNKSQNNDFMTGSSSNKNIFVNDEKGNLVEIPYNDVKGFISYYEPGNYKFKPEEMYAPYTEGPSITGYTDSPEQLGGICKKYKNYPEQLEQACNALDKNVCGSTNCCVLLGGNKCVSGNKTGPKIKSNYGDIFVKNKDFYFYNGDCYGNCDNKTIDNSDTINVNMDINVKMNKTIDGNGSSISRFSNSNIGQGSSNTMGSSNTIGSSKTITVPSKYWY